MLWGSLVWVVNSEGLIQWIVLVLQVLSLYTRELLEDHDISLALLNELVQPMQGAGQTLLRGHVE